MIGEEFIGRRVRILECTDPSKRGMEGRVVDETMKTFVVETEGGEKRVAKGECVFSFLMGDRWVKVDGRLLVARPEDRIKKERHLSRKWRLPRSFFRK